MNNLFRHLHMDPELAIEFIATFSRMEYALKSTTYANGTGYVTPAWSRFAIDINADVLAIAHEEFVQAKTFLLDNPPRLQIRQNEQLQFVNSDVNSEKLVTQILIEYVCTIRNNLFHGGKYMPHGEQEIDRNKKLVTAALIVLKQFYPIKANVRTSYEV